MTIHTFPVLPHRNSPNNGSKRPVTPPDDLELTFAEQGIADGRAGLPPSDATAPSEAEARILALWQDKLDARMQAVSARLAACSKDLQAQLAACPAPCSETINAVRTKIRRIVIERQAELESLRTQEQAARNDLEQFRKDHGLSRQPYDTAPFMLSVGVLMCLVLVEGAVNAVLFAQDNALGLLGGLLEAFMLSGANVIMGCVAGYLILRNLNAGGIFRRGASLVAFVVVAATLTAFNLLAAHYREFRAAVPVTPVVTAAPAPAALDTAQARKPPAVRDAAPKQPPTPAAVTVSAVMPTEPAAGAEKQAIRHFLENPFHIESFNGFILLFAGLLCSGIAMWKGYRLDDPYPGYGRVVRRHRSIAARLAGERKRALLALNAIRGGEIAVISRKLDTASATAAAGRRLFEEAAQEVRNLGQVIEAHNQQASGCVAAYREANRTNRVTEAPPSFKTPPKKLAATLPDTTSLRTLADDLDTRERTVNADLNSVVGDLETAETVLDPAATETPTPVLKRDVSAPPPRALPVEAAVAISAGPALSVASVS